MARSRYNYILPSELPGFIHTMSGVTDEDLAVKFISDAERIVDAFVGPAPRFHQDLTGTVSSTVASGVTTWPATIFGNRRPNYWAKGGLYVEILEIAGDPSSALVGEQRLAVASQNEQVTLDTAFSDSVVSGSSFLIHQESHFPRVWNSDPFGSPRMPDLLKVAVAWQVEYGILFGSEEFGLGDSAVATDEDGQVQARTYGSGYSETRIPGNKRGLATWIAPKARAVLREMLQVTGSMRA